MRYLVFFFISPFILLGWAAGFIYQSMAAGWALVDDTAHWMDL